MSELATRPVSVLPTGTAFSRFVTALVAGRGHRGDSLALAQTWRGTPQVAAAFELMTKAATAPGTTTDPSWLGPLVQTGLASEALSVLRGLSIVGALEGKVRRIPFQQKVPRDLASVALGAWIGESAPIPVGQLSFDQVGPLFPCKLGIIVAVTRDLVLLSVPSADAIVRGVLLGGLAAQLDRSFLDPTSGAVAGRPASITSGAIAVASTGSTGTAITADLSTMVSSVTTNGAALVWIMKPTTFAHIATALGMPNMAPTLYGLPVITSANSPQQITLVDAQAILVADDGGFDVGVSEEAAVEMNTTPANPTTAASVITSFYQQNLVGVKALRWINWLRGVDGSVVYMTVSY